MARRGSIEMKPLGTLSSCSSMPYPPMSEYEALVKAGYTSELRERCRGRLELLELLTRSTGGVVGRVEAYATAQCDSFRRLWDGVMSEGCIPDTKVFALERRFRARSIGGEEDELWSALLEDLGVPDPEDPVYRKIFQYLRDGWWSCFLRSRVSRPKPHLHVPTREQKAGLQFSPEHHTICYYLAGFCVRRIISHEDSRADNLNPILRTSCGTPVETKRDIRLPLGSVKGVEVHNHVYLYWEAYAFFLEIEMVLRYWLDTPNYAQDTATFSLRVRDYIMNAPEIWLLFEEWMRSKEEFAAATESGTTKADDGGGGGDGGGTRDGPHDGSHDGIKGRFDFDSDGLAKDVPLRIATRKPLRRAQSERVGAAAARSRSEKAPLAGAPFEDESDWSRALFPVRTQGGGGGVDGAKVAEVHGTSVATRDPIKVRVMAKLVQLYWNKRREWFQMGVVRSRRTSVVAGEDRVASVLLRAARRNSIGHVGGMPAGPVYSGTGGGGGGSGGGAADEVARRNTRFVSVARTPSPS